jgi:hypothetical protein
MGTVEEESTPSRALMLISHVKQPSIPPLQIVNMGPTCG